MLPSINQVVKINIGHEHQFSLKSRIAEISENEISIEVPINEETGKLELIPVGQKVKVWYMSNVHGQFSFDTIVVGRKQEQIPLLILTKPVVSKIHRVQRRNFLRVPVHVETAFKPLDKQDWTVVQTLDLSGGGMQVVLPFPKKVMTGEMIEGWIVLPFKNGTIEHISYIGEIIRSEIPNQKTNVTWVSISFTTINETMRSKIIRFCYERQVELREKGL
ncbi:flagellar brake protein [Tepidibacillus infernus]|uniref:flagellar brake protein n=1 Tax=Tepidibacillus infernus TaxID=1806172 RepID=UPI003A4A4EFC